MDPEKKRFAWGIGLAWVPIGLLVLPSLVSGWKGISQEKATGLGAVAAGIAEALLNFGLVAFVVCEVTAIVLLLRVVKREQWRRSLVAVVSVVCSVIFLVLTGLAVWWLWHLKAFYRG
jgi:hypothetical protein